MTDGLNTSTQDIHIVLDNYTSWQSKSSIVVDLRSYNPDRVCSVVYYNESIRMSVYPRDSVNPSVVLDDTF
jgi:hypothetical protein